MISKFVFFIAVLFGFFLQLDYAYAEPNKIRITIEKTANSTNIGLTGEGTYQDIIRNVRTFRNLDSSFDKIFLEQVNKEQLSLAPPYFLEAARRSCKSNPKAAVDWLSLYTIRSRYDAFRCIDKSARGNVQLTLLALQMPECKSAFSDKQLMIDSLAKTIKRKDIFSSNASAWWICSSAPSLIQKELKRLQTGEIFSPSIIYEKEWLMPEEEWEGFQQEISNLIEKTIQSVKED